jgi:hypothetical protein
VERTFEIDDPSQLSGLLERPPDGEEVPEIEYAYDTTPPGGLAKGAPQMRVPAFDAPLAGLDRSLEKW